MEVDTEHQVTNLARSVAMLTPGQWALTREQALQVLNALHLALQENRRLRES